MLGSNSGSTRAAETLPDLSVGVILRRIRDMALLWLLFGAVCGACSQTASGGGLVGVISGVLAGMIVLPFLGVCLGLMGGRVQPTLVGGCFGGLLAGLLGLFAHSASPLYLASFGLILGGLAGGTQAALLWWLHFVGRALGLSPRTRFLRPRGRSAAVPDSGPPQSRFDSLEKT
jgi:hypothetical protein